MCAAWEPLTQTPSGPTLHFYSTGLSMFTLGGVIPHLTSSIINRKQLRIWHWTDPPSIFTGTPTLKRHRVGDVVCFCWCWTHLCQESRPSIGVGSNPVVSSIKAQFNSARFQCHLQGLIYLNMNMNMGTCTFGHDRRIVPPGWGPQVNRTSRTLLPEC